MSDHTLLGTTNAMVWAEEFCRIFNGKMIMSTDGMPDDPQDGRFSAHYIDEGTMVGWFASAIETGRTFGRQETCPHTDWHVVSEGMKLCPICGLAVYAEADGEPY